MIHNFNIQSFYHMIEKRKDQIDEDLIDILLSFSDFMLFKEMMLAHKFSLKQKEMGQGLLISGTKSKIHIDEVKLHRKKKEKKCLDCNFQLLEYQKRRSK